MVVLVATFKAKPGCETELENKLMGLISQVQNEENTLVYTLHKEVEDPNRFLFYEVYRDKEAREFHRSQPYVKEVLGSLSEIVEEPPAIRVYEKIGSLIR